jgi:GAF domain-containing protein
LKWIMDRQQEILRAIAFTSQYLSDVRNLDVRLPAVVANLGRAAGVRRVYIYENVGSPDGRLLVTHRLGWSAFRQSMLRNSPKLSNLDLQSVGLERWIQQVVSGQAVFGNIADFPTPETKFLQHEGICSIAVIPILNGDECWGFIGFDDYNNERPWLSGEIEALTYIGRAIGAAFENARLFRAEAQRRREAEILNEVSGLLTQSLDLEEALNRTLEVLLRHLAGELTLTITLLEQHRQELVIIAQKSHDPNRRAAVGQHITLSRCRGVAGGAGNETAVRHS